MSASLAALRGVCGGLGVFSERDGEALAWAGMSGRVLGPVWGCAGFVRLCHERVKVRCDRSFSPAPLATIPATAAGFWPCGEGERSNGIISASGISLLVLVRHGNHLRVLAKKVFDCC